MFDAGTIWLRLSYFFLSNRAYFKKWWVIGLVAVDVFVLIFAFTNALLYILNIPQEQRLIAAMAASPVDYPNIRLRTSPQPLAADGVVAIRAGAGTYDLIASIKNENVGWAATAVRYHFTFGQTETEARTDFIMPQTEKFVAAFNVSGNSDSLIPALVIEDISWQRYVGDKKIPEVAFDIQDAQFSSSIVGGVSTSRVTAQVANLGLDGFWKTRFIVVLQGADQIVGLAYAYFDNFKAGETRSLYVQPDHLGGAVRSVRIIPDINLLDAANVM